MRGAVLWLAVSGTVGAQVVVRAPDFRWPSGDDTLLCQVTPIRPVLNFGLRLQAGYTVRVPLNQYKGAGHGWRVLVRVTPGDRVQDAVYFASSFDMPPVPETNVHGEIGGGFLVGEGHYSAALVLTDDLGRACSHAWQIDAHFERSVRGLQSALAPGAVTDLSWVRAAPPRAPEFGRLTVLLHAAPALPHASVLQVGDLERWLGELASLLELSLTKAPAQVAAAR